MSARYQPIGFYTLARPFLFLLPPEKAHHLSLRGLALDGRVPPFRMLNKIFAPPLEPIECCGLQFPNRIGMAAGYDKNALALDGLAAMGFGHIEVGTITPRPQKGNPYPRVVRIPKEDALVNRLGFPNEGVSIIKKRILSYRQRATSLKNPPVLGINIGKNKDTPNERAKEDYLLCYRELATLADYMVINISSPNTPGLRALQNQEALLHLLSPIQEEAQKLKKAPPLFVKLSPDLSISTREELLQQLHALNVDGVILSNTQKTQEPFAGGKSGLPLRESSLNIIRACREQLPKTTIIASGGIGLDGDTQTFVEAGADLIQIWTALVYRGPSLLRNL